MIFQNKLVHGTLIKRYKRFLAYTAGALKIKTYYQINYTVVL